MTSRSRITALRLPEFGFGVCIALLVLWGCAAPATRTLKSDARTNKAESPATTLVVLAGEPSRGREVVTGRDGNCLLCHAIPESGAPFMGDLGPSLSGIGARLSEAQLRLRLVDPQRFNPDSIMPAYARTGQLAQVGKFWRGKPILSAQQIEDAVAYLVTLR